MLKVKIHQRRSLLSLALPTPCDLSDGDISTTCIYASKAGQKFPKLARDC